MAQPVYTLIRRLAVRTVVAVLCVIAVGLAVPVLCADAPVGETQKPGEAQKAGKTDESGEATETKVDLTKLSIEDLMNIEVTIASKKPESWFDTASAVYVLTGEDIKRSGVTNIPDALRLVPGVDVGYTSGNEWAVSIRGFNDVYATKLLVLIDGRTVYSPMVSGIYWDVQDVVMEDIDRIEVVRGPGASMWGINAVNGIINIITKSSEDTQGTMVTETVGSVVQNISVARYGGKTTGGNGHYRVFGKYLKQGPFVYASGGDANDSYDLIHGGFRSDWNTSQSGQLTFQGDIYTGGESKTMVLPFLTEPYMRQAPSNGPLSGGNLLARWTRSSSSASTSTLQVYYDHASRSSTAYGNTVDTIDFDYQHNLTIDSRHEVTWGLGYRYIADSLRNTFFVSLFPPDLDQQLISAFAQGDIVLKPNLLRLTIGSKFENNYYTGFEVEPNIRLLWTPDARHTGWAAVSRAVRIPVRVDDAMVLNALAFANPSDPNLPYTVTVFGNRNLSSEDVVAFEAGYRVRKGERLSLDAAAFYNIYDNLVSLESDTPFFDPSPAPHIVIPFHFANMLHANSYGIELAADWRPRDWWRIVAGYSYLRMEAGMAEISNFDQAYHSPPNQFFLRSSLNLPRGIEFDSIVRYVDKMRSLSVPSYWALDLRLAWKPAKDLEMSLVGRNLLSSRHEEFLGSYLPVPPTEVPRSFYGYLAWTF